MRESPSDTCSSVRPRPADEPVPPVPSGRTGALVFDLDADPKIPIMVLLHELAFTLAIRSPVSHRFRPVPYAMNL